MTDPNRTKKTFKFRIYPSSSQKTKLEDTLDLCRELYNAGLQERRDAWRLNLVNIHEFDQCAQLPAIKEIRDDLKAVHAHVLQNVLYRVNRSFQNFFRRVKQKATPGFPRFQNRQRYNSFTFKESGFKIAENGKLRLSKIGDVRIKLHRELLGNIKTLTVSREDGRWYACFSCEVECIPLPPTGKSIGIDVGIASFATLSNGIQIENNRFYQTEQKKLRIAQRTVARRKKGSHRRRKAVAVLRSLYQSISNRREDFQHKLSTALIAKYDVIAVEKLNVSGMSKGSLSKQILDVSWSSFFSKLKYKAEYAGREFKEVSPQYTSQTCSSCGHCEKANRPTQASFKCVSCGHRENADVNASRNILRLGLSLQELTYVNR